MANNSLRNNPNHGPLPIQRTLSMSNKQSAQNYGPAGQFIISTPQSANWNCVTPIMSKGINSTDRYKEFELIKEASNEMSHLNQKSPNPYLKNNLNSKQSSKSLNKT
jgi:hypothetical protein